MHVGQNKVHESYVMLEQRHKNKKQTPTWRNAMIQTKKLQRVARVQLLSRSRMNPPNIHITKQTKTFIAKKFGFKHFCFDTK